MRILAVLALTGVLFAATDSHAIIVKDKNKKVQSNYDKPVVSSSVYSKSSYSQRPKERYAAQVRLPERTRVAKVPKKTRKRTHFSEWP